MLIKTRAKTNKKKNQYQFEKFQTMEKVEPQHKQFSKTEI